MLEWKPSKAKYAGGSDAYLGRIRVGWAGYSATGSKSDVEKYAGSVSLPGVRVEGKFMTEDDAKRGVEEVAAIWVRNSGLAQPKKLP